MRLLPMNSFLFLAICLVSVLPILGQQGAQKNGCPPICDFTKFDEIRITSWADEKARLDNVAISYNQAPSNAVVYLLAYGGRVACVDAANARNVRAKHYLVTKRGIAPSRVIIIDGGYREEPMLEVWILPSDITRPEPNPTVDRSQARLKNCKKRISIHPKRA